MSEAIDRIQAQKDMRTLTVTNAAQSEEGAKSVRERLEIETGQIVKAAPAALYEERDELGFAMLREMAKQRIG